MDQSEAATQKRLALPETLPRPALLQLLRYLRSSELHALGRAYPSLEKTCQDELNELDRELAWRGAFKWSRTYDLSASEMMASRQNHCMAYLESQHAMYLFGGETTNIYSVRSANGHGHNLSPMSRSNASFNDLWRLDLATMRWSRVIVRAPPYPLPKSMATMVVWKNELVLYGGFRPLPEIAATRGFQTPPSLCEVHIFNPVLKQWRQVNTNTDGPCLAGHTATISGNLMIVYGGWDVNAANQHITRDLHVLDLVQERWYTKRLAGGLSVTTARRFVLNDPNRFYPELHPIRSHLLTLREGELLLIGEMMPHDYGCALLVKFDPGNPENSDWQWRCIEVTGRWNRPKLLEGDNAPNFSCSLPNFNYPQMTAMRTGRLLRLVSLGLPIDKSSTRTYASTYDKCQLRGKKFVERITQRLINEMDRRESAYRFCKDEEDVSPQFENVEFDGITCKLGNCYMSREMILKCKKAPIDSKPRTTEHTLITVHLDEHHPSQKSAPLDDVDLAEIVVRTRKVVEQLHAKYSTSLPSTSSSSMIGCERNSSMTRMCTYVADIQLADERDYFAELNQINWRQQPIGFRAPPDTEFFSLTGGRGEVVMHGGSVVRSQQEYAAHALHMNYPPQMRPTLLPSHAMGHTYLLSPIAPFARPSPILPSNLHSSYENLRAASRASGSSSTD